MVKRMPTVILIIFIATIMSFSFLISGTVAAAMSDSAEVGANRSAVETEPQTAYRLVTAPEVMVYGSGNGEAYYTIQPNNDNSYSIFRTDYVKKQQDYLCNDPDCSHDSVSCSCRIEAYPGIVFPAALEDRLVLVYSSYDVPREGRVPSKVETMNLDGTGRKVVCTFPSDVYVSTGVATDNKSIVLVIHRMEYGDDRVNVNYSLVRVDLETGEKEELYSTYAGEGELIKSFFIRGATKEGFVLKTITTKEYDDQGSFEEVDEACRMATTHEIFLLPYDDNSSPRLLLKYTQDDAYEKVYGEQLVCYLNEGGTYRLKTIDITTGEEETVIDDFSAKGMSSIQNRRFGDTFIYGFVDGHVLLNHLYEDHYLENGDIELLYTQYAVDLTTGEWTEVTLSDYYMVAKHALILLSENNDQILTYHVEESGNKLVYQQKMIATEDYLNSEGTFSSVDQPVYMTSPGYAVK